MTILSIADKLACAGAFAANTGKLGCLSLFGEPAHLIAMQKGSVILATDNFDVAFLKPLIQRGIYIPLIDASSFEDVSAEDTYSTSSSGVKRLNLKGLPEYKLMFEEGHEFYRQLAKLEGFKSFDFLVGDDAGNWLVATKSDGNFKGFVGGHTTPELTKRKVSGGDAEQKSFLVQFLERLQWDETYSILHADQLDFTPQEVPSINGVVMAYEDLTNGAVAPTAIVTIQVGVVLAGDNNTRVEGLLIGNFIVKVNGSTDSLASVVEDDPGFYTITLSAALVSTDVVITDVWDNTLNVDVTDLGGVLYRGEEVTATVA